MAAFINPFVNVFNLADNAQLELAGARDVKSVQLNGKTYLYVAGLSDNGIAIFEMNSDGSLVQLGDLEGTAATAPLYGVTELEFITVDGTTFLVTTAQFGDSVTVYSVDPNTGQLTETSSISDDVTRALNQVIGLDTAVVGGKTFVLTAGATDDGISVFEVDANGILFERDTVFDDNSRSLNNVQQIHTEKVGNNTLVFATGRDDSGVTVFRLKSDGTLTQRFNLSDTATTNLNQPTGMDTVKVGNKTYLVVAGQNNGLSTFEVASNGTLTNVDNFNSPQGGGLYDIDIKNIGGINMIIGSAAGSWNVVAYAIDANGMLEQIDFVNYLDDPNLLLRAPTRSEYVTIGDSTFIVTAGSNSSGLSVFEIGATEDAIIGTGSGDIMVGLAGDDEFLGRGGFDTLNGGDGSDLLSGGSGNDTLIGGAGGDILIGGKGNDTASYLDSGSGVTVNLSTGAASGGEANGDTLISIERLVGSTKNDTLTGTNGSNKLNGNKGSDTLNGLGGKDTIDGGNGNDTINGGGGDDSIKGGKGNDTIDGGGGADTIKGGSGADTINGGTGNDTITGGNGGDTFVFEDNFGNDVITDYVDGSEQIDLSGVTAATSFANLFVVQQGNDALIFVQGLASSITLEDTLASDIDATDFIF